MTTALTTASLGQLRRQGVRRLRAEWALVTPEEQAVGVTWYDEAHVWVVRLAFKHGITTPEVAGIAATLSPRLPWHRAIAMTEAMLDGHDIRGQGLRKQVDKAQAILDGGDPYKLVSGVKVTSFFHNLMGEYSWVTIDKWAFDQVSGRDYNTGDHHMLERRGVYETYADCFRVVAFEQGLEPAVAQAVLWISTRGKA
ncbi:MAG: hypothetical protein DRH08_00620 [Deltaproteobacteria bacterium]|nr:MAG: hypothetical protein DRH08_00620 [Deltaproteobacteria bacterium]